MWEVFNKKAYLASILVDDVGYFGKCYNIVGPFVVQQRKMDILNLEFMDSCYTMSG